MRRKFRFHVGVATIACALSTTFVHAQIVQQAPLRERLEHPITCLFQDTHLSRVLEFIAKESEAPIVMDDTVVAPRRGRLAIATNVEYATDGNVEYINFKRVAAGEALHAVLHPLGLTYALRNHYVWVSTPENIKRETSESLETRIFQLPGTSMPDCNAATNQSAVAEVDLVAVLRRATPMIVEPETGELLSYMRFNLVTNQIVVHNTPTNLKRLEALLDLLLGEPIQN